MSTSWANRKPGVTTSASPLVRRLRRRRKGNWFKQACDIGCNDSARDSGSLDRDFTALGVLVMRIRLRRVSTRPLGNDRLPQDAVLEQPTTTCSCSSDNHRAVSS